MAYKVLLFYFRATGRYLTTVSTTSTHATLQHIWDEMRTLRRLGRLPGLRPNAGRDLYIVVEVPDLPQGVLELLIPPSMDVEDVTPSHVPLGEAARTSTRDVVKVNPDLDLEEDTVVQDVPPEC